MSIVESLKRSVRSIPDFPRSGIQFKDITPILGDARLLGGAVEELARPFREDGVTKVVGIEARGFILGAALAHRLDAGFVPVRKQGKLPYETVSSEYELEYGVDVIEMHVDAIAPGDRVLIHDDVIATGGTAAACFDLVKHSGGLVVGYAFLLELLALEGRKMLDDRLKIHTVLQV